MNAGTSPWPWMKGRPLAVADPIDPVCPEDERPAVRDLIDMHRTAIDKIAEKLGESKHFDPTKHDDLWILRYLISHKGKHSSALDAALRTLEYRAENNLDSQDIREFPPGPRAKDEAMQKYFACINEEDFIFDVPHPRRGVVAFIRAAGFDQTMQERLTPQVRRKAFGYVNEWTHQWLDFITRTTGRLTKSVRLVDAKGTRLLQLNYRTLHLEASAANSLQDFYPQMLESFYICDPPSWQHIPWKILRPLLPKRVVEKVDFVAPFKSKAERKRLLKHLEEEHLPVKYGGQRVLSVKAS